MMANIFQYPWTKFQWWQKYCTLLPFWGQAEQLEWRGGGKRMYMSGWIWWEIFVKLIEPKLLLKASTSALWSSESLDIGNVYKLYWTHQNDFLALPSTVLSNSILLHEPPHILIPSSGMGGIWYWRYYQTCEAFHLAIECISTNISFVWCGRVGNSIFYYHNIPAREEARILKIRFKWLLELGKSVLSTSLLPQKYSDKSTILPFWGPAAQLEGLGGGKRMHMSGWMRWEIFIKLI